MGPIGWQETVLIFIVALMLFGPKELPKIGKTIAKALNDFKRASSELKDTWQRELNDLERETQDIRSEITKETDQISQTTSNYGESYYNQDSSYDYGAYGTPEATVDSSTSTEPALAVTAQLAAGEASPASDAPAPAAGDELANTETVPVVAAAQGTVPTQIPLPLPPPPPTAESASRDEASSL
jgi:sec-independent protein translocase protein TatA